MKLFEDKDDRGQEERDNALFAVNEANLFVEVTMAQGGGFAFGGNVHCLARLPFPSYQEFQ